MQDPYEINDVAANAIVRNSACIQLTQKEAVSAASNTSSNCSPIARKRPATTTASTSSPLQQKVHPVPAKKNKTIDMDECMETAAEYLKSKQGQKPEKILPEQDFVNYVGKKLITFHDDIKTELIYKINTSLYEAEREMLKRKTQLKD